MLFFGIVAETNPAGLAKWRPETVLHTERCPGQSVVRQAAIAVESCQSGPGLFQESRSGWEAPNNRPVPGSVESNRSPVAGTLELPSVEFEGLTLSTTAYSRVGLSQYRFCFELRSPQ